MIGRYKISMNVSQIDMPPWSVEDTETGKKFDVKAVHIDCKSWTESDRTPQRHRGWMIAEGVLVIDSRTNEATIK